MEQAKHKDISVGGGDTGGGETLAEPMEVVLDGNNGEDIMVEVLGSDVFVDGVRSHDGGPVDEAKPDAEAVGKLPEGGVAGADLGDQSVERDGRVSGEGEDTILKEVDSSEIDAQIGIDETEEEGLIIEDTQLLDEDTQLIEETLVEQVYESYEDNELESDVVKKGGEDAFKIGQNNDGQSADVAVGTVEQKTQEAIVPGEDKLSSKDGETRTDEANDDAAAANGDPSKEMDSVAVEGGTEQTAVEGSLGPAVTIGDAVPGATPSPAADQKVNGESIESATVLVNDVVAEDGKADSNASGDGAGKTEQETLNGKAAVDGMVDSSVGQDVGAHADVEKVTADGNEGALEVDPLKVESVTVVTESVTVVTEVVETVEKNASVDMLCEGTQGDVEMIEANEGVIGSNGEAVQPADNNQKPVDESLYVEDKEVVNDAVMVDIPEDDDTETDDEEDIKQDGAPKIGVRASYQLPPEKEGEGEFSVSDLVWGKVRSHPWWPGQIFDPSDASEQAVKHQKKDSFLVAYFGDRTFAWNEANLLKPFRIHFSVAEKQGSSESFQNAVDCALEEVARRVELGLACSCTPKEAMEKIEFQVVENTGIKEESSKMEGAGDYLKGNYFEPNKLLEYLKELAQLPRGGADRLELVIAKAQLLSFYRLKGYTDLPEFLFADGFSDEVGNLQYEEGNRVLGEVADAAGSVSEEEEEEDSSGQDGSRPQRASLKRKHNLRDSTYPFKKGRSMAELMGPGQEDRRKSSSAAKVTSPAPAMAPKPSFKIGETIKRIASQLTASPNVKPKNESDPSQSAEDAEKGAGVTSGYSSMEDLLSQLQVAAQEPMQEHSFSNVIACFFSDFRNSVVLDQNPELGKSAGGVKRKRLAHLDGSSEAFEFEDMNDSYWTDRIIENGAEEEPHSDGIDRRVENQLVPFDSPKPHKTGRRPYTKRRVQETNHELPLAKQPAYADPNAPAELVMVFPEFGYLPSEANLSRMFKRFGPIRESYTEVDRETSRVRVVFKKYSDAEVACGSAGRFNIFGPIHVTYQLNCTVSETIRSSGLAMMEVPEEDGF